jgi:prevent-host-death family protein
MAWQLQQAKARFSEVVQRARAEGPQTVTLRGERAAVVGGEPDFVTALLAGPAWPEEMSAALARRAPELPRDIEV